MSNVDVEELIVEDSAGHVVDPAQESRNCSKKNSLLMMLIWLVAIFLAAMAVFVLFRPPAVLGSDGEIDYGKAALASLIVALAGAIVVALVRSCRK